MSIDPSPDWAAIERREEFRALVRAKRAFVVPASLFFVVYYFALPALGGYWPEVMSTRGVGHVTVAYLFALSQFVMGWAVMAAYVHRARAFDRIVEQVLQRHRGT